MIPSDAIIKLARRLAVNNDRAEPYKMSALIYDGNKVLGIGLNKPYKTHPKAWTPYKTIHAEFDAILDATRCDDRMNGKSMYVHRVRRDGLNGLAKPCVTCQRMLAWVGIREVHWSK